jgi:hypothetical protein
MVCRNRRRSLESGKEPSGEAVAVATHVMAGTRISAPQGGRGTRWRARGCSNRDRWQHRGDYAIRGESLGELPFQRLLATRSSGHRPLCWCAARDSNPGPADNRADLLDIAGCRPKLRRSFLVPPRWTSILTGSGLAAPAHNSQTGHAHRGCLTSSKLDVMRWSS